MNHCLTCSNWRRSDDALIGRCNSYDGWRFQFEGGNRLDCRKYVEGETREPGQDHGLAPEAREALRPEVDRVYEAMRYERNKEMPYWKKKALERKRAQAVAQ